MFSVFDSVPDWYKTQEWCDRVVSEDPLMLLYYLDIYKTQRICDETVDYCLAPFKFISDLFVTSKMLEKFHDALNASDDILILDEDFSEGTFFLLIKWVFLV